MGNERLTADGQTSFRGGQDASKVPDQIPENAYASGVNVSVENGVLRPRYGYHKQQIVFPTGGIPFPGIPTLIQNSYENVFKSGKYQMAAPYVIGTEDFIVTVISGIIFLIRVSTLETQVLSITDGSMIDQYTPRVDFANAGKYLVIFDYPAYPVIIEGNTARRADPANNEVPISVMGAYNQNRLFITNAGSEFTAGDPTGNLATPEAPITFDEILTPGDPFYGQIFQLPTNDINSPISAITFLQQSDTSTGIGPLLIATANSIFSFQTQQPRSQWETTQFGSMFVYNAGIAGLKSFVNVNSDLFFMSSDGQLRSVSMSRDEQMKWSKVPLSREVQNWIKFWDASLVQYAVLGYFNNKIFATVNPYRVQALDTNKVPVTDYAHGGLIVMELDNVSNLSDQAPPVWAGLWTGINPMDIVTVGSRCFIFSKDSSNINNLYEVVPESSVDIADGNIRYIRSVIYTREHDCKDAFRDKDIHSLDINLESVQGDLSMKVRYKPSQSVYFLPWREFSHKAPWRTCKMPEGCEVNGFLAQSFKDLNMGAPVGDENACDPVTKALYRVFRKLQLKFIMEAKYWELHEYRLKALNREQTEQDVVCSTYPKIGLLECCTEDASDWYVPPFHSCILRET